MTPQLLVEKQLQETNESLIILSNLDASTITLPFIIKNKILLSPGNWNGYDFTAEDIANGFRLTDWSDKKNFELIKDHADTPLSIDAFLGYVRNLHLSQAGEVDSDGKSVPLGSLVGDLEIYDKDIIIKLAIAKAKFGISAKVKGYEDGARFLVQSFNNFSIVDNPACKTAYINLSDNTQIEEELGAKVDKMVSEIKDSLKKSHPDWDDKKIEEQAWKIVNSKKKSEKMSEDDLDDEDEEEIDVIKEAIEEDLSQISSREAMKGGFKEEQTMESTNQVNVESPQEQKLQQETVKEVATETKLEEAKVEADNVLTKKLEELSNAIIALTQKVESLEKSASQVQKLSERKEKVVEGHSFAVAKPLSIKQLASSKDSRHSQGILAMAQQLTALQSH